MSTTVCRGTCPKGSKMINCAVSGGTLEAYISRALDTWGDRLCLRISPTYVDFPLPCPSGKGTFLSPGQLKALYRRQKVHYSQALLMEYFTYLEQGTLHIVLFDTQRSLRDKFALAKQLSVPMVYIPEPFLRQTLLNP